MNQSVSHVLHTSCTLAYRCGHLCFDRNISEIMNRSRFSFSRQLQNPQSPPLFPMGPLPLKKVYNGVRDKLLYKT